jgi:oxaloacetate decarboxylase alpha subunit
MPAEQVDAMLAAGPAPRRRPPELQPLLALLHGLAERDIQQVVIERPDLKLELR